MTDPIRLPRALHCLVFLIGLHGGLAPATAAAATATPWTVVAPGELRSDTAVAIALDDLQRTARALEIPVSVVDDSNEATTNAIMLGGPAENRQAANRPGMRKDAWRPPENPDGFRIAPLPEDCLLLTSRSPLGYAYGLYWIRDRMRVHRKIPADLDCSRSPAFKVRLGGAWGRWGFGGRSKEDMRIALRNSINWVAGAPVLDLVPWNSEPEATRNAQTREDTRALIEYAHALHMQYFAFANEFTYHPSLLEMHGATLTPADPKFWDALQEKFRMLFTALPELDGIELCNDDISGFWDNYRPYDLLHEPPEPTWSYARRFRTFVQSVHDVVVGEFDKTYFHFTWSLSDHEQHTQAAVFRDIFTEAVPTENLYLMPKVTRADRWWHQAYNPTFNQTPHDTVVLFETMNYYEGGKTPLFPTFSGDYFQRGLQTFLMPEDSNVRGIAMLANISGDGWGTRDAYAYVLYRLLWDPDDDMGQIAADFCAIHFGPEAAEEMAAIYRKSARAYKYGLHIEPISYGQYNSFYHMRVGVFPVEGYPRIDGGRQHLDWLRTIYLRIKPWEVETLDDIRHGLALADEMYNDFQDVAPKLDDSRQAEELALRLDMTRKLIATHLGYVASMLAYFDYLEQPTADHRQALEDTYRQTRNRCDTFAAMPRFDYKLWGVEALLDAMSQALDDIDVHRAALAAAPTRDKLHQAIAQQQERAAAVLAKHQDEAVKVAHIRIQVDGRDILSIRGDKHAIDHIRWDPPHVAGFRVETPLPARAVTIIPRVIESRPLHPFVLAHPNAGNNFTAQIYLDDLPGGQGWMEFELFYIDEAPETLGLDVLWQEQAP